MYVLKRSLWIVVVLTTALLAGSLTGVALGDKPESTPNLRARVQDLEARVAELEALLVGVTRDPSGNLSFAQNFTAEKLLARDSVRADADEDGHGDLEGMNLYVVDDVYAVDVHAANVESIADGAAALAVLIATNIFDIEGLQKGLATAESVLDSQAEGIAENNGHIVTNKANIADNKADIATLDTAHGVSQLALTELQSDLDAETVTRAQADDAIRDDLQAEEAARILGDDALVPVKAAVKKVVVLVGALLHKLQDLLGDLGLEDALPDVSGW